MWDFFESLFGGAFWIGKCINEKHKKNVYENRRCKASAITNMIRATAEQEEYIKKELLANSRFEFLKSISSELSEVYGDNWSEYFVDISEFDIQYQHIEYPWGAAFHILLAKQGIKPRMFSTFYSLIGDESITARKIKVCELIEKNIQKYHPELKMVFVPGNEFCPNETYHKELCNGKIWWEHEVTFSNSKYNLPVQRLW